MIDTLGIMLIMTAGGILWRHGLLDGEISVKRLILALLLLVPGIVIVYWTESEEFLWSVYDFIHFF